MAIKEHPIIIFLDRNGFIIYQDTLSNVWQFPFAQDLVVNLDVINKIQLENSIGAFIQTNKISPSSLIIILSDSVVFQKDLASLQKNPESTDPNQQENELIIGNKEQQEKEIRNFLDIVPFEDVLIKVINNNIIVVVNKDLLEALVSPFKAIGCVVDAIVPGFIYKEYSDFSGGLSQDIVKIVLQQTDLLKLGNILTGQQQAVEIQKDSYDQSQKEPEEKPSNIRQFILIGVFVFLIAVLAIVYFTLGREQTFPEKNASQPSTSLNLPNPTPSPQVNQTSSQEASASSSVDNLKTIKITIVGNTETEALSNALENLLTKSGFQNITTEDSISPIPARSSVLFSKSIPDSIRETIIAEIKKIFPDILVQENQELESVITIILGKST